MYAKLHNGVVEKYPYTIGDLRKDNPNTSFSRVISNEVLAEFGVVTVVVTGHPEVDHTKTVTEGMPVFNNNLARWEQNWIVADASSEELAQRTDEKATQIRAERNALLAATDWRFRSDMNPSQEWKDYCQALRDITEQSGFPWNVVWPQEP